jgi:hypothetical protein
MIVRLYLMEAKKEKRTIKIRGNKLAMAKEIENAFVLEVSPEDAVKIQSLHSDRGVSPSGFDLEISIIKDREEGDDQMTPEEKKIKEEIAFYDSLSGKAKGSGENIDELIELSQRKEKWRGREVE